MSNYNSLKATINANIKTNGNEEITGSVLNSVLNAMVTTIGAGYQYMGVATPSTNPGSPDARVFYVAAPGTYHNFNNAVVAEKHYGFLKYDTAWHTELLEIPGVVDIVDNLVDGGSDKALSAEQGKVIADVIGEGFFVEVTPIPLNSLTIQDCTMGSSNKWYRTNGGVGKHIAVPLIAGRTYRLTLRSNPYGGSFYGFVTSAYNPPYVNNDTIPFISGESSRITLAGGTTITFVAGSASAYLILTYQDGGGITMFPFWYLERFEEGGTPGTIEERIISIESRKADQKLRVMAFNIGHFSLGTTYDTTITQAQLETMRTKWRQFMNPLGADVVLASEYNTNFVNASGGLPAVTARDAVFAESVWKYAAIGTKPSSSSYIQQAIFSNHELKSVRQVVYPQVVQSGRYYQDAVINLDGTDVHLVSTHLDWDQGEHGAEYRALQIQKLITDFADTDHVIIGGDFNVTDASEFDAFLNAGWVLMNHGYMGDIPTCPASNPGSCFDNIICKGFSMKQISAPGDATLSDHLSVLAELTLL